MRTNKTQMEDIRYFGGIKIQIKNTKFNMYPNLKGLNGRKMQMVTVV